MLRIGLFLVLLVGELSAQPAKFELRNKEAIKLTKSKLNILCNKTWYLEKSTLTIKGIANSYSLKNEINYFSDGKFSFNGKQGTWKLLNKRYIIHQFEQTSPTTRTNFGGTFAITYFSDTSLVLTKTLTSSMDMVRQLYLSTSTSYPYPSELAVQDFLRSNNNDHKPNMKPILWRGGPINEEMAEEISRYSNEDIFIRALRIRGDTILIHTADSLYKIKRKPR